MNLKEQLYVCTLARCRTITRASEELYISQPALSTYISNLEKHLGVKLFERTGKSFLLTAIGEEYVIRAEKMLKLKEEFDAILEEAAGKHGDSLRVGVQQRRAISLVPYVSSRFHKQYPAVNLSFRDTHHEELLHMFRDGEVDILICMCKEDPADAECMELCREPVLIALHKSHPAVKTAYSVPGDPLLHLDLKCLENESVILPARTQSLRMTVERLMEQFQVHPGYVKEISSIETIISMVNENLGIGFNRMGYVSQMKRFSDVRYFMIGNPPAASRVVMIYKKEKEIPPYMDFFVRLVQEAVNKSIEIDKNV